MSRRGFTLIEILVVLAVIALLASIIFVRFNTARARARDAERVQEIRTFQNALALYFASNNTFPIVSDWTELTGTDSVSTALTGANTLSAIPQDPLDAGIYIYEYRSIGSNGASYELRYSLETDSVLGLNGEEGADSDNPQLVTP